MKKFVINFIFYVFAFFMCVYLSGHIEDKVHHIKCGEMGYYVTGQYAVIDLKQFTCDFTTYLCNRK